MWRSFPLIRQTDVSDCGAAALATVARYHGLSLGLQQMRELAGTDRVGTNLSGLVTAAEKLGFSAKAVKGPYEAVANVPLPAVAHVNTTEGLGHFVVLYRATKGSVIVADPARGVVKLSRESFCQQWTGYLLLMVPDQLTAKHAGSAPVAPWRRFLGLLSPNRGILAEAFVCAVMMTLLGISTSYFIQHLVDSVLVRGESRLLGALGIGMLIITVFRTLFGTLRHYLLAHIGRKADLSLISGYTRHILELPTSFFEMRQVGEILSRVQDAAKVREAISGTTLTAIVDGVLVVITSAVLWIYDVQLALVATLFVPFLMLSVMIHHPSSRRRARAAMEHAARLSAHLVEDVSGVETIKAYNAHCLRSNEGEQHLVDTVQSVFSLQKLHISMSAMGTMITGVAGVVILWYGGNRVIDGALTTGELMFFYTLLGYMLEPLERLSCLNLSIQDALVAVDRLYQVMDMQREPLGDNKARLEKINEAIELKNVSFRYGCRANVLEQIDLRIPAGATVALVGESGCGKSTLLKLLMRFYDPTSGQILIDGVDMRDFDLATLRDCIGVVSQEPFVFNGTLRENVALGRPDAPLADIIAACRAAGLDEFIAGLPERYDTVLGERGANISGGQRQRLAIARALLKNPEILIFDEATSHLDTATERAIQENLTTILAHKTVVLVAHRLSTVRDADVICVVDKGRIVEQGTHHELIARRGQYAALWRAQTGSPESTSRHVCLSSCNGNRISLAALEN